ncbi:MarR family transcriptional regulator [Streptomyces sp. NPDC056194]|uniref:MarR family transcriptional regulator n=1 Tax=unclassified Streptomyces TaxID=2593676 RepID=UPI0035D91E06
MRGRGRPYQPLSWHAPGAEDGDGVQGDEVTGRRREGYGGPAAMRPARAADPNGDHLRTLSPDEAKAYGAALFGTPSHRIEVNLADGVAFMNADGCVAHAEQQLYGDPTRWLRAQMTVVNVDVVGSVLGHTRAAVLGTIARHPGCSTQQLAVLVGIAKASASEHATTLRNAGLIATHRDRRTTAHIATPTGIAVLNAPSGRP